MGDTTTTPSKHIFTPAPGLTPGCLHKFRSGLRGAASHPGKMETDGVVSVGDPFSGRQAALSYRPLPLGSAEVGRGCRWIPPSRYTEPKGTHPVPHDSDISAVIPLASAGAPGSEARSPSGGRGETEAGRAGAGAAPAGEDGGQPPGARRGEPRILPGRGQGGGRVQRP